MKVRLPRKWLARRAMPRRIVFWSVATLLVWHLIAGVVFASRPTFNNDYAPDTVVRMSAADFAREELGLRGPVPLQLKLSATPEAVVELRLATIYDDTLNGRLVVLEVRHGSSVETLRLSYDKVTWHNGPSATIALTLGDKRVNAPYVGEGYSYWRWLTCRGAEHTRYIGGATAFGHYAHDSAAEVLALATAVTITLPNDPAWAKVRAEANFS